MQEAVCGLQFKVNKCVVTLIGGSLRGLFLRRVSRFPLTEDALSGFSATGSLGDLWLAFFMKCVTKIAILQIYSHFNG